ncbi:alpha/beta hydrolase [Methanosphaera cuniculi]|uniref:alpha/beta hydrolase n=1 Tax=Methanosphaera cuniculi TaxID=1077256 RepID=UPI0026F0D8B9|nr:alpha/beta hydrolase [Methanosphaera cuniculi]
MGYDYIHPLSENVERESVRFFNRFNTAIEGDLYYSKNIDKTTKHPAIIIGAPYGGVKEQGPCVYANELAQRGFIVLTFAKYIWDNQVENQEMYLTHHSLLKVSWHV